MRSCLSSHQEKRFRQPRWSLRTLEHLQAGRTIGITLHWCDVVDKCLGKNLVGQDGHISWHELPCVYASRSMSNKSSIVGRHALNLRSLAGLEQGCVFIVFTATRKHAFSYWLSEGPIVSASGTCRGMAALISFCGFNMTPDGQSPNVAQTKKLWRDTSQG